MRVALCMMAMLTVGCGAIFHGSTDTVAITSNVDRATVRVDGAAVTQTPGQVTVASSHPHTLSVSAPGYRESSATINSEVGAGWVVLDCLWLIPGVIPGVVALIVDGASGDWREASTERVHLMLERDAQVAGPGSMPAVVPSAVPAVPVQPWAAARDGSAPASAAPAAASTGPASSAPSAGAAPAASGTPAAGAANAPASPSTLPPMPPPPPPPAK